ncbi:hypothetical protein OS493_018335 [Desmophyllum pertusum]|uniref:Uncharacterized protein n=1 Tax=Desmophyllum pertusum TaxID=174260 RepID=A0A9X0CEU7_9CNID|nr:hypothetical protein OS493_018335 [Desmophyllum pertusum]
MNCMHYVEVVTKHLNRSLFPNVRKNELQKEPQLIDEGCHAFWRSKGEETTPSGMTLQYPRANLARKTVLSGQTKAKSITNLLDNCSWDREPLLPKEVTSSWHTNTTAGDVTHVLMQGNAEFKSECPCEDTGSTSLMQNISEDLSECLPCCLHKPPNGVGLIREWSICRWWTCPDM